jgi:predicted phage baseplate assembly protein
MGINATLIAQRTRVLNELLPEGTGEPDQTVTLSHPPVIPSSVKLIVTPPNDTPEQWQLIDDLLAAGAEVPTPDLREPPGRIPPPPKPSKVFALDPEAGRIRFGDGARGARPPAGATLRVSYEYGAGRAGNVGAGAVNQAPALPAGLKVLNPERTWGGAEGETIVEGEKQIAGYLQHRDRLVTATDFETIAKRTPGVDIGRVEVLAAYNPTLARQEPGSAPGAVTLMLIPKYSSTRPDAPSPDQPFLASVCAWLDPRRLVTTELFLLGPQYISIWVSVAIEIVPTGADPDSPNSTAVVREAVKRRVREFLAPVRADGKGWPLRRTVLQLELMAEISRVEGVALVNKLVLAAGEGGEAASVPLKGLELPRLDGIEVTVSGDPLPLTQLRGVANAGAGPATPGKKIVPVPVIPANC